MVVKTRSGTSFINQFVAAAVLSAVLLVSGLGLLRPTAASAHADRPFLVKLASDDPALLHALGNNVVREYPFSKAPEFQNVFGFDSSLTLAELAARLGAAAVYVQPDNSYVSASVLTSSAINGGMHEITANDPGYTSNPLNIDKQWAIPKAGFDYAWSLTMGSTSNIVAIVDTGIDGTHEDLQALNLVPGYNFLTNQVISGRVNSDDNGHGTLVAGVLGATANNGTGVVGTNWAISVMPLKALDSTGKGDSATVSQAIVWAADHGANFINLSLGGIGFGHDTALQNAISYAFNKNVLIVAAAGNDTSVSGENLDKSPVYPVCDDNNSNEVIGVAATDQNDLKADFSDYGKNCIDVGAPGKRILSTINFDPLTKIYSPNSYAYVSGTSVAVPFVVGEAALIRAMNPGATNVQIRDQILATAYPIDNLNLSQCGGGSCAGLLGRGRIDVRAALAQKIQPASIQEGDLVTSGTDQTIFLISGGQKRPVSMAVMKLRFNNQAVKVVSASQLDNYDIGPYATPAEGTLVKSPDNPTVYEISSGQKLPVTAQVFQQRGFNFGQIATLSGAEVGSWLAGNFLSPAEGTLVKTPGNQTVYWVVGQALHPINYNFYINRGLNVFSILYISQSDLNGYAKGDAYIR